MRTVWRPSKDYTIGGVRAIELVTTCLGHTTVEYCLASKYGEIWSKGTQGYAAIVKRVPGGPRWGDEQYTRFGEDELQRWIGMLRISDNPKLQTIWANNFEE